MLKSLQKMPLLLAMMIIATGQVGWPFIYRLFLLLAMTSD